MSQEVKKRPAVGVAANKLHQPPENVGSSQENKRPSQKFYEDYAALPRLELVVYGLFLLAVISRAFYDVYQQSQEHAESLSSYNLEKGWFILGNRQQDVADYEWSYWKAHFFHPYTWVMIVMHALLGRMVGHLYPKYRNTFLLAYAFVTLLLVAGFKLVLFFVFHSLIVYAVACTGKTMAVWCTVLLQLATLNFSIFLSWQRYIFPDEDDFNMMIFIVAMCSLRHISFSVEYCQYHATPERLRPSQKQYWNLQDFLLYVYYLPLFYSGPVLTYDKFSRQINLRIHLLSSQEWKYIIKELVRYIFWALFLEFVLHFLYFPSFHTRSTIFRYLPIWSIGGLALCHLLFFQTKYVVMFGLSRVLAMFDHINAPLPPVCVLGMYLFQDFWRYFDRGLHSLLVKYIYIPLGGSRSGFVWQMMASAACFSFVFYWHGGDGHLLYWAILNCAGLQLEVIITKLAYLTNLNNLLQRYLSGPMYRRLMAAILTPNYMCLALSNLIFLGGTKNTYVYYDRIVNEGWPIVTLLTFSTYYCTIQVIMEAYRILGKDFLCNKFYYR